MSSKNPAKVIVSKHCPPLQAGWDYQSIPLHQWWFSPPAQISSVFSQASDTEEVMICYMQCQNSLTMTYWQNCLELHPPVWLSCSTISTILNRTHLQDYPVVLHSGLKADAESVVSRKVCGFPHLLQLVISLQAFSFWEQFGSTACLFQLFCPKSARSLGNSDTKNFFDGIYYIIWHLELLGEEQLRNHPQPV